MQNNNYCNLSDPNEDFSLFYESKKVYLLHAGLLLICPLGVFPFPERVKLDAYLR